LPDQNDAPVRVRLRYPDLETFVEKFAPNVTRGGIFLASRSPRPVGQVLRFEVLLRQGAPVLSGNGRVTWVKEFDATEPHRPYGMGVQFLEVDVAARPVLERLLQRKQARPTPPPSLGLGARAGSDGGRATDRAAPGAGSYDDLDDTSMRRTLERARALSARTDDLDGLLALDPEESATLSQALDDLPRLLAGRPPSSTALRPVPDPDDPDAAKKDDAS
jgi:uncharacterized protein (TIGR02266 family)